VANQSGKLRNFYFFSIKIFIGNLFRLFAKFPKMLTEKKFEIRHIFPVLIV
jgi:hypothetical protein